MKEERDIRLNYQLRKETFNKLETLANNAGFTNIRVYIVQKLIPNYCIKDQENNLKISASEFVFKW